MVKVKGFPGALYPPDAPQDTSPDSDFVLALKRTAARIGAWPWDPDGWDDSYSNRFAHGDGWNDQTHAGIEGLQHWSGTISPTGNVGEKTFNFLRSVKVPQGRTHAGEMAMDSVAVNLINAAYEDSHPANTKTVRAAAHDRAVSQIGYTESGDNNNKFGSWYGENGVPYCAIGMTWCFEHGASDVGKSCPTFYAISQGAGSSDRYDYVPYMVSDARNGRFGLSVTGSPQTGDLVAFDWNWNGEYDHVGMFEEWLSGRTFQTVEFNTSPDNGGSQSNGGGVYRRQRDANGQGTIFMRVAEP